MSIQGDVVKGSQTRSVCLSYFPIRAGHFALKDSTTKMKAEIGTHAPTALRSRDALGQQQHRNKTWATGRHKGTLRDTGTQGNQGTQRDTGDTRDTVDTRGHKGTQGTMRREEDT